MTGLRGASLDWDSGWRVTPGVRTSQETRPGLSHGINLRGKNRGGAPEGARARSTREWQHSPVWRAAASADAAPRHLRLTALRLPSFKGGPFVGIAWQNSGAQARRENG